MTTATAHNPSSSNPGGLLAPGFRFHPTDEELVSYYLKRKLSGRSLRVDAIADVDVYGSEPWDLPAMSRLRSKDMEWYFFSSLDRKYSNRSRTNRATREGYWKTTGKDRSVFHRSVVAGMKKTLVFHVGRAPKGQRTNWVMHEYRLHDSAAAAAAEAQDGYVVCRIFQKTGSGPQNGAQYGAPYVEEEWEEDEQLYLEPSKEEEAVAVAANEYVQLNDFVQKQDTANQHENSVLFAMGANVQDGGTNSQDPANLLEEMFDVSRYVNDLEVQDEPNLIYNMGKNTGLCQQSQSPDQNDGYLELKDIFGNGSMSCPSNGNSSDCPQKMLNDNILVRGVNESLASQEVDDATLFDNLNVTADPYELCQMCLPVEGDFSLQTGGSPNLAAGSCNSAQPSENMVFYDAPSQDLYEDDIFMNENQLQFSPAAAEFDDLMAYFDATDNNLQYIQSFSENVEFGSSNVARSNSTPEVEHNSNPSLKATPQVLGASVEGAESSSTRPAEAYNKLGNKNASVIAAADAQNTGSWNKSLKKHVVNILGSINAPPAMAEDLDKHRAIQLISPTHTSSSIRVSAGMIQLQGAVMGSAEHWTLQKNRDMGFFLSYGMAGNDVVGKSVCFESITEVQGGAMSMMLRGGLYLFGIYMLILAITFKVGMCIYSK